jgi:argininosuccinate lyase
LLLAAYHVADKNPLGSGAGYGSSFPLNRTRTTELLGFAALNNNAVYAQMTRGKTEKFVAIGISAVAATLSKLAMDCCLYLNQNFGFISFPTELTTGSSIMPHKKNPDVFELIRAKCNRIQATPNELTLLLNNLPSGYHRDLQFSKGAIFHAFGRGLGALELLPDLLRNLEWKPERMRAALDPSMYATDLAVDLARQGMPFRDAYKQAADPARWAEGDPEASLAARVSPGAAGDLRLDLLQQRLDALR